MERQFTDDEIQRTLTNLRRWHGRGKEDLAGPESEAVRNIITNGKLVCVPVAGAAAIFYCSISLIRHYEQLHIIEHDDIGPDNAHLFSVERLRRRRHIFRSLRRKGMTLRQIGQWFQENGDT